jgi:hypothetical protein
MEVVSFISSDPLITPDDENRSSFQNIAYFKYAPDSGQCPT